MTFTLLTIGHAGYSNSSTTECVQLAPLDFELRRALELAAEAAEARRPPPVVGEVGG